MDGVTIFHSIYGSTSCRAGVKSAFLAEHGVFRRLNPNAESRPSPPDQKQSDEVAQSNRVGKQLVQPFRHFQAYGLV